MKPAVWAPQASTVTVATADGGHAMRRDEAGWWHADAVILGHGDRYGFRIDGGDPLPDPRSRRQPDGVHGLSAVYDDTRFGWSDRSWTGRPLAGGVVYELHVGTFTPGGTLDSAIARLDHLVRLGITHVELMPVVPFDGPRGWGYDGVHLWAVHEPYGGPDALKRFVDACHVEGLAVILDVVHNHLGPSGNVLPRFGPYFTDRHSTPWGPAVNLDDAGSDEVREWIIGSSLMWLRDMHMDGLRLDAVHALADDRAVHLLEELSERVDALSASLGRPLSLIAESDRNDPRTITPRAAGGLGVHAQWCDDVHHALHATLSGERQGYYGDFGGLPALAQALTRAFVHDGSWSSFRGRRHGRPVDVTATPGWRFVAFLQDHDQVGNRATGDRLCSRVDPGLLRIGAALLLTSAFTPMLFMGEEWAASTPWCFFSSFPEPALGRAVTEGRRREFARHGWSEREVPDPQDARTFADSVLDWDEAEHGEHAAMVRWYRDLIALRRRLPDLADPRLDRVRVDIDEERQTLVVRRGHVRIACALGDAATVTLDGPPTEVLLASHDGVDVAGCEVHLPSRGCALLAVA